MAGIGIIQILFLVFLQQSKISLGQKVPVYFDDIGCFYPDASGAEMGSLVSQTPLTLDTEEGEYYGPLNVTYCANVCYNSGFQYTAVSSRSECPSSEDCSWYLECRCLGTLPRGEDTDTYRCPFSCTAPGRGSLDWCLRDTLPTARITLHQAWTYKSKGCFAPDGPYRTMSRYSIPAEEHPDIDFRFARISTHSCVDTCRKDGYRYAAVEVQDSSCASESGTCRFIQCACAPNDPMMQFAQRSCPFECHIFQDYNGGGNWCFIPSSYSNVNIIEISEKSPDGTGQLVTSTRPPSPPSTTGSQDEEEEGMSPYTIAAIVIGIALLLIIALIAIAIQRMYSLGKEEEKEAYSAPYNSDTLTTGISGYSTLQQNGQTVHVLDFPLNQKTTTPANDSSKVYTINEAQQGKPMPAAKPVPVAYAEDTVRKTTDGDIYAVVNK